MARRCAMLKRKTKGRCENRATRLRDTESQFPIWVCKKCDEQHDRWLKKQEAAKCA